MLFVSFIKFANIYLRYEKSYPLMRPTRDVCVRAFSETVHSVGTRPIDTNAKGRCPISISLREATAGSF